MYRFREMLMWQVDGIDGYFSNPCRKYISYENKPLFGIDHSQIRRWELNALRNALAIGQILNRTVILPKFHCVERFKTFNKVTTCNLLGTEINPTLFQKMFPHFREHVFLSHSKVPLSVKNSKSLPYVIHSSVTANLLSNNRKSLNDGMKFGAKMNVLHLESSQLQHLYPGIKSNGADESEIRRWFMDRNDSVLQFLSLYNAFSVFGKHEEQNAFQAKIAQSFIPWRQKIIHSTK